MMVLEEPRRTDRDSPRKLSDDYVESNSVVPGGSLVSKPTWSNTSGCSATSAFFVLGCARTCYETLLNNL